MVKQEDKIYLTKIVKQNEKSICYPYKGHIQLFN